MAISFLPLLGYMKVGGLPSSMLADQQAESPQQGGSGSADFSARRIATFPKKVEQVEIPGSQRAHQQWLQRVEYVGMQQKKRLDACIEQLDRCRTALTNAEKRQDSQLNQPEDFLRHWDEARGPERRLMVCKVAQQHMDAGCVCCLPKCLTWLYSLRCGRQCARKWAREAEEEARLAAAQAANAEPGEQDWSPEEWITWRETHPDE